MLGPDVLSTSKFKNIIVIDDSESHLLTPTAGGKRRHDEEMYRNEKRRQPGVTFPSASKQSYILVIRLNLKSEVKHQPSLVKEGLRELCSIFGRVESGDTEIEILGQNGAITSMKLAEFNLTATIGFGIGFFNKLSIGEEHRPRKLYDMPTGEELGDPEQYIFDQTDMILQICSTNDFVNRSIFKSDSHPLKTHCRSDLSVRYANPAPRKSMIAHDVVTAVKSWAVVTDVHSGYQRQDGRNLMGFIDGISQPDRLYNDIIWTTNDDEADASVDGTYMVFQKIEFDLERWNKLSVMEQEKWIGRSKATGLLLGTLSRQDDIQLAEDCRSTDESVSTAAKFRLKKLLDEQKNPYTSFYNKSNPKYKNIALSCPIWSHVRKANPRGEDGAAKKIIYRRGYLFTEDTTTPNRGPRAGLLFICFQKDIRNGFEYIKRHYLNNKNFPVPEIRKSFDNRELSYRHSHGRFSSNELRSLFPYKESILGIDSETYSDLQQEANNPDSQNSGREGLSGPSQLGVYPHGDFVVTCTLGGGYYFIPHVPNKRISEIGQQFFC